MQTIDPLLDYSFFPQKSLSAFLVDSYGISLHISKKMCWFYFLNFQLFVLSIDFP